MARRKQKVRLVFITRSAHRRTTYKNRLKGLMKKVSELSILCGVDACVIVNNPFNFQFEVCPENPFEVHQLIDRFTGLSELDQKKKMFNEDTTIRKWILKLQVQLIKKINENRKTGLNEFLNQSLVDRIFLNNLKPEDHEDLSEAIDQKLTEVIKRIEAIKIGGCTGIQGKGPGKEPINP